jgi:hypothetical protein
MVHGKILFLSPAPRFFLVGFAATDELNRKSFSQR